MATVRNDRDVLLQAASVRDTNPSLNKSLTVIANTPVINISNTGVATPTSVVMTASAINIIGSLTWEVLSGASSISVAGDTKSATLLASNMTASSANIKVSILYQGVTYVAFCVITKVLDGANGSAGSNGLNTALAYAYKRAASAPSDNPGSVTFTFASNSITTPSTDALSNGWTKSIPTGTDPLYVTVASASNALATDSIGAGEWATPARLAQDGVDGLNTATIYLYQRATSTPSVPGSTLTYTFATGALTGTLGSWSRTVPAGSNPCYVTTATALSNSATDTIASGEWASPTVLSSNGAAGQRGTVNLTTSGSSWSDTTAENALLAAGYGLPQERDVVTITNAGSGGSFVQTKFYSSGAWNPVTAYIDGNLLVSGTVAAASVTAGTFTGQRYRTASSGTRIDINESGSNFIRAYSGSTMVMELGGNLSSGASTAFFSNSSILPTLRSAAGSTGPAGYFAGSSSAVSSGGAAVVGENNNLNAPAVYANNAATLGDAILASGRIRTIAKSSGAGAAYFNECLPLTDNLYSNGTASLAWSAIYSVTALNVTSDAREKTDIEDSDLGLAFIDSLRAVSYRLVTGAREVAKDAGVDEDGQEIPAEIVVRPGVRRHYGFLAQQVQQVLPTEDTAIWCLADKDDPESKQSLRYGELIAPLVRAVQELHAKLQERDATIAQMKERMTALEDRYGE